MKTRALTAALVAVALLTVPLLSCFSEHDGVIDPGTDGEGCSIPTSAIGPNRAVVLIRGFTFWPDTLRVRAGTTVTWVNCEPANIEPHTSTADNDAWDSGSLSPGESFARAFPSAGANPYFCTPHPAMRGTILVQ
jgi:plastocyanin